MKTILLLAICLISLNAIASSQVDLEKCKRGSQPVMLGSYSN